MEEASITWFTIYHLHYKDKFNNQTRSFIFVVDNLHSLYSLSNFLIASAYASKPSLVMKKKTIKNFFISYFLLTSSSLF